MQAAHGDNEGERPMWAEKGGLDFEGRARWDAWTERKGMKPPRAKMLFVQVPSCPVRPLLCYRTYAMCRPAHTGCRTALPHLPRLFL